MPKPQPISIAPPLPANIEAERAVLGSIMLDNRAMDEASTLKQADFSTEQHRKIFKAMLEMSDVGEAIDIVTLTEWMGAKKGEEVSYAAALTSGLPKAANISSYVSIIRRKAMLRRVIEISDLAQHLAFDGGDEEAITEQAARGLQDVLNDYADKSQIGKTSRAAKVSAVKKLEDDPAKKILRIKTGVTELDRTTGGFGAGELVTITASATGSGKTLFAQQLKANACEHGMHGLYFSGEMPAEQLENRDMATHTGIPHWKLRRPWNLTKEEYTALFENAVKGCDVCRIVDGDLNIRGIRTACRRMKATGQLSWVILDYDELIDAPGKDEFQQQRNVIREAKRLAITLEIPVMVISGIRKPLDNKEAGKPMLERIYGSGAKTKHSSFVIFVDRPYVRNLKPGTEAEAKIFILKSRDGQIGKIDRVTFNTSTLRFEDKEERDGQGNEES